MRSSTAEQLSYTQHVAGSNPAAPTHVFDTSNIVRYEVRTLLTFCTVRFASDSKRIHNKKVAVVSIFFGVCLKILIEKMMLNQKKLKHEKFLILKMECKKINNL